MQSRRAATIAVLLASVAGQMAAANAGAIGFAAFAAGAFLLAALRAGLILNRPWWSPAGHAIGPSPLAAQPVMAARNGELLALGYGWGALSLLAIYLLTPLRWQHGWEYGVGMALIAALLAALARHIAQAAWTEARFKTLLAVSVLHGTAALTGLAWLVASGKVWSLKGDWAANIVFVSGALLIAAISAMGIATAIRLSAETRNPLTLA